MNREKVIIDTGSLNEAYRDAKMAGKIIESFDVYECSLVVGGGIEMGPPSNIKYRDEPQHIEFLGHDLRSK